MNNFLAKLRANVTLKTLRRVSINSQSFVLKINHKCHKENADIDKNSIVQL